MTCSTLVETWSFRNQLLPIANAIKHILNLFKGLIELRGLGAAIMACSSQHAHLPKRAATEQQWLTSCSGEQLLFTYIPVSTYYSSSLGEILIII